MGRLALLAATAAAAVLVANADSSTKQWKEHFYGRVIADGYEYFAIDVPRGVYNVDLSVTLSALGPRTPPVVFLKKDGFPTEASYDYRLNTTHDGVVFDHALADLQVGRYYATVWGGNLHGSVYHFGVGPSDFMWWYLDFYFSSCVDVARVGSECKLPVTHASTTTASSTSSPVTAAACVDVVTPATLISFDVAQPVAALTINLAQLATTNGVSWAIYLNHANPLATDAIPVANATAPTTTTFQIKRPQTGTWTALVLYNGDASSSLCSRNAGARFTIEWVVQAACDPTTDPLCSAAGNWTPLDENRNAAYPRADYIVAASFSARQPVFQSSSLAPVGYEFELSPMYAGTDVLVHLGSTLLDYAVYIRVDGWPTTSTFDYAFNASQASPIHVVTMAQDITNPTSPSFDGLQNASTAASFVGFPAISFPKPGHWYIVVQPKAVATPGVTWGVALQVHTAACPDETDCNGNGNCVVKTSYQGFVYGECVCSYGFGGRECNEFVYSPSERQTRTALLLLSNGAILPAAVLSFMRKLHVEAVLFFLLGVISGLYHACDLNMYCIYPYPFLQGLDFAFTFNAIMLGFIHLSGAFKHVKAGMQVFVLVALILITTTNATSMKNWLVIGIVIAVQFVATWTYYLTLAKRRLHASYFQTIKRFLFHSDNFDWRFLGLGVVLWGSAFVCFFTSTGPTYWLVHSIWHCTAMLAAFAFIGLRKNIRYQCVGTDGKDVLSHEATDEVRHEKAAFKKNEIVLMRSMEEADHVLST
ncbi:Aste57867_12553 [Aphanomyces stellatus]|uniref:Aste57867_12553 protein n=1 Tax=Aphanomyces stellatus TaxID=120398 RepID=A0A485KVX8_9STRA|nr:hypothetical protein As57867_012507 [Aphanomyces stellatus]VFT89404.1 Aste57867_12553 [Aphanomyces stellatus]